jgi:hypothetical protein
MKLNPVTNIDLFTTHSGRGQAMGKLIASVRFGVETGGWFA